MTMFMLFVFFCLCSVLAMAFFLYGKQVGEDNAYGLGICVNDLDLRISNAEAEANMLKKMLKQKENELSNYETNMATLRDALNKKSVEVEDFKKLADTYVKESIQYYDRIKALEEELERTQMKAERSTKDFGYLPALEELANKKKPGRPRRTLPKAPLLDEAS